MLVAKTLKTLIVLFAIASLPQKVFASPPEYESDGLSREQARAVLASKLFDIPLSQVPDIQNDFTGAPGNGGVRHHYNVYTARNNSRRCSNVSVGGHPGIDFRTENEADNPGSRETFYALNDGEVIDVDREGIGRIAVYNQRDDTTTYYLHASGIRVRSGNDVKIGDPLGNQDGVGGVTPHVHLEVRNGRSEFSACGANAPGSPRVTKDPVDYLYPKLRNESRSEQNLRERRTAAKILAPLIAKSRSKMCNGRFELDFSFSSYAELDDFGLLVSIRNAQRREVWKDTIDADEILIEDDDIFSLRSADVTQRLYRVQKRISFNSADESELNGRALVRVYIANTDVQDNAQPVDDYEWNSYFTMFTPILKRESLEPASQHYLDSTQQNAQRYIEVDVSRCY